MSNNYANPDQAEDAYEEHYKHVKVHEVIGGAAAVLSMFGLVLMALSGTLDWNESLFNASLIAVALVFVMIEHDSIGGHWIVIYCAVMLSASVAAGFVMVSMVGGSMMDAVVNPATLNFLFGGLLALSYYGMQTDPTFIGRILWGTLVVIMFLGLIYMIPWESAPAGPIQDAGLWAESQIEPGADVVRNAGQAIHGCVTDPQACGEYMADLGETIIDFLQSLPIWPAIEAIFSVVGGYAGGMSCMLQEGFTMDPGGAAYGETGDNETEAPGAPAEDCFDEDPVFDPDSDPDDDADDDADDEGDDDDEEDDSPPGEIPGVM